MADMPLDPLLSKMLLTACDKYSCVNEILSIVSIIRPRDQIEQADREKNKFSHPDGDHLTLLNVFNAFVQNDKNNDWCWKHYLN
jgi:HrpA-like RNA helicase